MGDSPLSRTLAGALGAPVQELVPLGGSFAGQLDRVRSAAGDFALKWAERPTPGALAAEARGLQLLAAAAPDMAALGTALAAPHRQSADAYGLDHDNYLGGTPSRMLATPTGRPLHLLNHLNLFGESYGPQVDAIAHHYAGSATR